MKSLLVCAVAQLVLSGLDSTTSASSQERDKTFISAKHLQGISEKNAVNEKPSRSQILDVISSYNKIVEQNKLLEERLQALQEDKNITNSNATDTNTNTTNSNSTDANDSLVKKLDEVAEQVQSNAILLEQISVQQEKIAYQLQEDNMLNSSLMSHLRGFLLIDRYNSDSKWNVLKKGLVGLLDHSDVAYNQVQNLSSGDSMPMTDIIRYDYLKLLQTLLDYGLYVDIQDPNTNDDTFLHLAAMNDQSEATRLLLDRGANISARNNVGATPLIVAASSNSTQVLAILKKDGADLNAADQDGRTALHYAAEKGYLEVVRDLVQAGANTKLQDNNSLTPLDLAIKADQKDVVKYLSNFQRLSHLKY